MMKRLRYFDGPGSPEWVDSECPMCEIVFGTLKWVVFYPLVGLGLLFFGVN